MISVWEDSLINNIIKILESKDVRLNMSLKAFNKVIGKYKDDMYYSSLLFIVMMNVVLAMMKV
jgi:hypothetical protein